MRTLPYESSWPAEWTGQRRSALLLFGALFMSLVALGAAAGLLWELTRGDPVSALVYAVVTIYFGHLGALSAHSYRGGRHRNDTTGVRQEADGLVFRYGAGPTYLVSAFLGLTAVALVGLAVGSATRGSVEGYVVSAVLVVMAIFTVVVVVVLLSLAPGRVVLGVDGIRHRGLSFTHFVPWEAVSGVVALWSHSPVIYIRTIGSPRTVTRNYLGRNTPGPKTLSPFDTISGRWLAADPGLLLYALAYYIVYPADRPELSNGAALHRIAQR